MRGLLLLALSGCSFFATNGPHPPPGPTKCNRDSSPVFSDVVTGIGAAFAAGVSSVEGGGKADVIVPISVAGVFAVSAGYGAVQVHRCRRDHEQRPTWSLDDMPAVM
jgi:hypothetical protein